MTEYEMFGVCFFGYLLLLIIIALIVESITKNIRKRKNKRFSRKAKRNYNKMKKVVEYAEFIALSSINFNK